MGAAGAWVVTCSHTLAEVEAVATGYPIVFHFLPDLETFYRDRLGRTLPGDGADSDEGIERQGDSV